MSRAGASLRGRIELACAGAVLSGLLLAYALPEAVRVPLGTFVSSDMCPKTTRCRNTWGALAWLALLIVIVVVLVVLGRRVARWVLRLLPDLVSTIEQLGPQNLGQRVQLDRLEGEIRELAAAVNALLDRVTVGFEGQRRFAANASHELRTPLAVQRTLVEVAMVTGGGGADVSRLASQLLLVNERNEQLIEGLLVLAEADRGLPGTVPVRLDELVGSVLTSYADRFAERELTVTRTLAERTVPGDPVLLERLIGNLVQNAIKYNDQGGRVEVVVGVTPALTVRNTGERVPAEAVPSLFAPFRRLSADRMNHRAGSGLGLSIVHSIAAAHHGTVSAVPGADGGLDVEVKLP
ncbi:sensor histidine kinase [Amycolatopsis jiangsuensis]|uniref:histidine kinase n=1 Tax=Amycolatopsis jiangsuensis TaxID=1181879 RepID=A0A840IVW3_9PSEU|nr:HAMP domain-containing sensor histidine kinase [Amycolatopsis jiangsuensis]MBB4685575.1 signal transduction histidine kinase [Amycolatopsis jiangsuensis]